MRMLLKLGGVVKVPGSLKDEEDIKNTGISGWKMLIFCFKQKVLQLININSFLDRSSVKLYLRSFRIARSTLISEFKFYHMSVL